MDLGRFFGDLFSGRLFSQKKKEEDEPKPVTVQRPTGIPTINIPGAQQAPGTVQMPKPLTVAQPTPVQLGGVQTEVPKPQPPKPVAPKPISADLNIPGQPRNPNLDLNVGKPTPQKPTVVKPKQKSILDNIGDFLNDSVKNTGGMLNDFGKNTSGMINDFNTDPNNVPRNTINYILGIDNPIDGATLDYSKMVDGKPTLVPKAQPQTLQGHADKSLLNTILNELIVKPTVQAAPRLYTTFAGTDAEELPQWIKDINSGFGGYNNEELQSNFAPDAEGNANPLLGTLNTVGDIASLIPIVGGGIKMGVDGLSSGIDAGSRAMRSFRPAAQTGEVIDDQAALIANGTRAVDEEASLLRGERAPTTPEPETPYVPRDPNSPITESPTTNKPPAITSPNRPEPTVQQPEPFFQPPVETRPTVPQGIAPQVVPEAPTVRPITTPDEASLAAQKAIDEAAVEPVLAPEAPVVEKVEIPNATKSKTMATEATPINAQAVAADVAQAKQADAVQYSSPVKGGKASIPGSPKLSYNTGDNTLDAVVNDSIIATKGTAGTAGTRLEALEKAGISAAKQKQIRDLATKNVDKATGRISLEAQQKIRNIIAGTDEAPTNPKATKATETVEDSEAVDPRVAKSNSEADEIVRSANETLKGEKSSYAQVVRKLYNNNRPDGTVSDLTAAERKVAETIQPKLDAVLAKMNEKGLTDADMGLIADYLPTTKLDELNSVKNVRDLEGQDFGFTKTRGNKLSDSEIEEGAEQALRNYLGTGSLLDDLSPEVITKVKVARRDKEFVDLIEKDGKGGNTGLKLSDEEIATVRAKNEALVKAEDELTEARKAVAGKDANPEAISKLNKAEKTANDAYIEKQVEDYLTLERKTDAEIKNIRASKELTSETKKQRVSQLESHLTDVRNQTYYMQSTVRSNMLFGVGRIADQANKGIQSVSDKLTAGARIGANKSFNNSTGRNLFADNKTAGAVWSQVKKNPAINQARTNTKIAETILRRQDEGKGLTAKAFGAWRMGGTRVTEAGSRYRIAAKDTVSFFTEKAKASGLTDVKDITKYVQDSIGGAEWKRVNNALFEARNTFTGLPTAGRVASRDLRLNVRNAIYNKLGNVKGMSRSMRENIADGVTIPVVGFPRLLYRLGVRGLDNATLGVGDFVKAGLIKPKTEADALKKALLVQQGLRAAQNGGTLGALGVYLGASGMTTGAYPDDPNERARWEKDKIQPYSLKIGDQYVDVGRYAGPLSFPLMIGAAIGRGKPEDVPGTVGELTQQFLSQYGADSMGDVLTTAGNLLKGDFESAGKDVTRWATGMTAAFIPASSLLNTAGKAQDMATGSAAPDGSANFLDSLRARFPITRNGLPGRTDNLGNPISQGSPVNLLPGVSGGQDTNRANSDNRDDSVMGEVDRLAGLDFEVMPPRDIKNDNAQVDANSLMSSKLYKGADDEKKAEYLKETLAGSKLKDISKSVGATDRAALIEYTLQNEDERKVWLENNDNAASYYTGDYNNKKATNTLTSDDDNLQNKSGAKYKMLEAGVDKELGADSALKQAYDDISVEEWRKMIDPDDEDNYNLELAQKLFAYDEARTKAGVSGKSGDSSKAKFTLKKSGSGKGTGSSKFAFASLPSSLISTESSKKGYADGAPTFKPIADLKAPTEANIPKGRTISIKRGRQL